MSNLNKKLLAEAFDAYVNEGDIAKATRLFQRHWDLSAKNQYALLESEDEEFEVTDMGDDFNQDVAAEAGSDEEQKFEQLQIAVDELEDKYPAEMTDEVQAKFDDLRNKIDELKLAGEDDEVSDEDATVIIEDLKADFEVAGEISEDVQALFDEISAGIQGEEADTEEITVFPIPEDADASYVVSGNTQLVTGPNNSITIVVTAPNGSTKKTYTIAVEKLDYGVAVGDNVVSGERITSQPITITVREKPEDVAIPSGFVEGYLIIGATQVSGFVPSGENNGEPTYGLIYAANRNGEENFYKYDKEDGSIQKYTADPNTKSLEDTQKRLKNSNDAYKRLSRVYNIVLPVAIGLGVLVIVLVILLAIGSKGRGGSKSRFEDDFDDDDDDYFIRKPERKEKVDDADYDDIDDDDIEDLG